MPMGIAQQLGASLTGNIEQAYLVVSDYRQKCAGAPGGAVSKMNNFRNMTSAAAKLSTAPGPLNAPNATIPQFGYNEKTFKVQFNPSQLQIYARNMPVKKTDAQGKDPAQDAVTKPLLTLTTTLFFDEMNVYDSFMWDKFTGGVTAQGAKNIATAVMSAKGKVWTVQDEVEGFIAALRNPLTRNIKFVWADFAFAGQLNNVSAQYTMFSASGRPVRAKVLLRIEHEMDDIYLSSWFKDFETAFGGAQGNLLGAAQKAGNLLNLPL